MTTFDAILIPGGGLQSDATPHPWVQARLAHAMNVAGELPLVCLSGFTPHKPPPINSAGFPVYESVASANWLLQNGVLDERVFTETCSCDTIGNAYFARVIHTEPRHWRRLLVVTSEFHLPRTKAIFEHVFLRLPNSLGNTSTDVLEFQATEDLGMDPSDRAARVSKEQRQLEIWNANIAAGKLSSLEELHRWLYAEHDCYAVGRQPVRATGAAVATY